MAKVRTKHENQIVKSFMLRNRRLLFVYRDSAQRAKELLSNNTAECRLLQNKNMIAERTVEKYTVDDECTIGKYYVTNHGLIQYITSAKHE